MVHGSDERAIFRDDRDREDLLGALAALTRSRQLTIYAWALMTNHFHLLVNVGDVPLDASMSSLFADFSAAVSRRHVLADALPLDGYDATVCEDSRHFLELVRYIHLNPLRGGIVRDVDDLDEYAYTGHSAILSTVPRDWQCTEAVLERFGMSAGWARAAYRKFVCDGAVIGEQPTKSRGQRRF